MKKEVWDSGSLICEKYYAGSFVYNNEGIEYILFDEGRLTPKADGTYQYEYFLCDHLGNTRVVFTGQEEGLAVLQESHYYPFGMEFMGVGGEQMDITNYYKYNGKELQDDGFDLDVNGVYESRLLLYDYGARFYDAQLGRFHTQDAFAEKYFDLSTYQYAANNPIVNIDINGDSIWFTTQYDKNNELTGVTMHVTGTVIDNTSEGLSEKQVEKKRSQVEKGIEKAFKDSGDGIEFNASASITVSESEGSIKSSDHVFRLVDDVAETIGTTKTPGLEVKGQATPFQNIVYLDADLSGRSLQRTSAHELGHSGGLAHIKDATEITLSGALKPLIVTDYPKNLMHQSRDVTYPGFKIEPFQIRRIKKFYDFGLLNKGKQN